MAAQSLFSIRWLVFLPMIALNIFGIVAIASTTGGTASSSYPAKQIGFVLASILISVVVVKLPSSFLKDYSYLLYCFGIGLLVFVYLFGKEVNGARSWIQIAPGLPNIQPSEFMKYFLVLALARFLRYRETYHRWRDLAIPFILTAIPMLMILKQPDLGSAMIYMPLLLTFMFVLGFRFTKIILLVVVGISMISYLWTNTNFVHKYQKARVMAFLYPEEYKEKEAYQLTSSLMAIGDGGLTGKGFRQGTIHGFDKLPESHTDFVFAVISEDFGFMGATIVLALFIWLIVQISLLLLYTKDPFSLCLILGVMIIMFYQMALNMAVVLGLMPTTGVTLPLVSYGGSSVLANYFGVSLALSASYNNDLQLSRTNFSS